MMDANDIIAFFCDRYGFCAWWDSLAPETQAEIIEELDRKLKGGDQ